MDIHKSLYYIYENKYYNAFNPKDIYLLTNKFEDAFYTNFETNLSGEKLKQPINISGLKSITSFSPFYEKVKNKIEHEFRNDYFYKISDLKVENSLELSISGSNEVRIDWLDGSSQEIFKKGQKLVIKFKKQYKSEVDMINNFKDESKWEKASEGIGWGTTWGRYYWTRKFEIYNTSSKKYQTAMIKLLPKYKKAGGPSKAPSFDSYGYNDKTVSSIVTYKNQTKKEKISEISELQFRYDLKSTTNDEIKKIFYDWYTYYNNDILTNFSKNNKIDFNYDEIRNGKFTKNNVSNVYKDKMYNIESNNYYSVIQSFFDYQIIKEEIIKNNAVEENGEIRYKMRKNFTASKEQLDNYLYLSGQFEPVLKYSYGSEEDLLNLDGTKLANSFQEAKELQWLNAIHLLKRNI